MRRWSAVALVVLAVGCGETEGTGSSSGASSTSGSSGTSGSTGSGTGSNGTTSGSGSGTTGSAGSSGGASSGGTTASSALLKADIGGVAMQFDLYASVSKASTFVIASAMKAGPAGTLLTISVPEQPGTVACTQAGIIWSFSDQSDGSAFQGMSTRAGSSCSGTTTEGGTAAGALVKGTFTATLIGISGPRKDQPLALTNGTFEITHP